MCRTHNPVAWFLNTIMPTVKDCHCHGFNSRRMMVERYLTACSTTEIFYRPWAWAMLYWLWLRTLIIDCGDDDLYQSQEAVYHVVSEHAHWVVMQDHAQINIIYTPLPVSHIFGTRLGSPQNNYVTQHFRYYVKMGTPPRLWVAGLHSCYSGLQCSSSEELWVHVFKFGFPQSAQRYTTSDWNVL